MDFDSFLLLDTYQSTHKLENLDVDIEGKQYYLILLGQAKLLAGREEAEKSNPNSLLCGLQKQNQNCYSSWLSS